MASKYDGLARIIIQNIGGKSNVISVTHCVTRLRFKLQDESKANTDILKATDGVAAVIQSGGQYQIVIGNQVAAVYDAVCQVGHFSGEKALAEQPADKKLSPGAALIDLISGTFLPVLGVLSGVGIIRGLLAVASFFGLLSATDGTYVILNAVGTSFFYFLPIILGMTAAEKMGGNKFIGISIGCSMCYPAIVNLSGMEALGTAFEGTIFATPYYTTFLKIPVLLPSGGYTSTVVPIIVAVFFAVKMEKLLQKIIPDVVKMFFVPLFTLIIIVPVTFLVIGPITGILCALITQLFNMVFGVSGLLAGAILGGMFQVFVIFGLHWGLTPLALTSMAAVGYDNIIPTAMPAAFVQTATVLAVYLKSKDEKLKKVALPAVISGLFGITETAIYGVTLPKKKPFVISCLASAVSGAIMGALGVKRYSMGGLGIFALATYLNPETQSFYDVGWSIVAILVGMVVSFAITFITYKDEPVAEKAAVEE